MSIPRHNPIVRFFSSIRVGLVLMALILVYASIASALPQVRGAVEMTEMQIFRHWVFTLLIALFTVTLVTATIVRIPFRFVNAGVLTVHTGLLLLVGGSLWYFSTKVEGDVLLVSPRVQLVSTGSMGNRVVAEFPADAGQTWSSVMPAFGGAINLNVVEIGRDTDGSVNLARVEVRRGNEPAQVHDVSTRDSDIPIVADRLALRLESFPVATQFYDNETPALYVRRPDNASPRVVPIHGLPLFRERYLGDAGDIVDTSHRPAPSKRTTPHLNLAGFSLPTGWFEDWHLPIRLDSPELPFDVEITGFIPYVSRFEQKAVEGTDPNPAVNLRLSTETFSRQVSLFAQDHARSLVSLGLPVEFRWVKDQAERDAAMAPLRGAFELDVEVKDPPVHKTFSVRRGDQIRIEGTSYQLTVKELAPSWPLMTDGFAGAVSPMASVDVTNGTLSYNRTVIQRFPHLSQDIDEGGTRHRDGPYDPNLVLKYRTSAEGWISVVAGPGMAPMAAVFNTRGVPQVVQLPEGKSQPILIDGVPLDLTLEQYLPNGRPAIVPVVEPLETRRPNIAMRSMSAIRLVLHGRGQHSGWSDTQWCLFSQYPTTEERSIQVTLPGESEPWEVVYSRFARDLGVALLPGKLTVTFFPGRESVESWRSDFGVGQADGSIVPAAVYTNETFRAGNWTLFQSGAAKDHWSYTVIGVGNREGIWPMILGCVFITIGCMFAFYVKPILLRRRARQSGTTKKVSGAEAWTAPDSGDLPDSRVAARAGSPVGAGSARTVGGSAVNVGIGLLLVLVTASSAIASDQPFDASRRAAELDAAMDWSQARLIAVQDAGRYKTLDSFARESMTALCGREHLPGLSPMASMFEWLFNREAYAELPVIRIKDKGVRIHLSTHLPEAARRRIQETGYMTPRELSDKVVESRIEELEPLAPMLTAMRRVRDSQVVARMLERLLRVVPAPGGSADAAWFTPNDLVANLPLEERGAMARFGRGMTGDGGVPGVSADQALTILGMWASIWKGWTGGDAAQVQGAMDRLAAALPAMAGEGVYPSTEQREAEAAYYSWGKFTWGMWIYLVGALLAVPAMVTGWRGPRMASILLLVAGIVVHGFGISLRWYILGRIPVANMFEAVVGSAWLGVVVGLLAEWRYKSRVFLLAANVTGFLALALGSFVIPGGGTLTTIMGILDDLMLRIHTVLIIASYALIFLASVIAVAYLFGYYYRQNAVTSSHVGFILALCGGILWAAMNQSFEIGPDHAAGMLKKVFAVPAFGSAAAALWLLLVFAGRRMSATGLAWAIGLALVCTSLYIGDYGFCRGAALTFLIFGLSWAGMNRAGIVLKYAPERVNELIAPAVTAVGGPEAYLAVSGPSLRSQRPILAGGAPGDEGRGTKDLPLWMHHADWSHMIILNMVFIMLFVGIILGAVWADYSWGRPWGWDPKEVFALNTLIIYAILIHIRFVVKNRGLWTAWLSVAGCLMMAFNWCFVNFYIVGLHSYA